jgi:hypothetical protein
MATGSAQHSLSKQHSHLCCAVKPETHETQVADNLRITGGKDEEATWLGHIFVECRVTGW